ncbi:MAG: citrate (Si)-synthase, partial [Acidimicrobiia bacterium]
MGQSDATLHHNGKEHELEVVTGTEDDTAIEISELMGDTGLVTLDYGYANTASTRSAVTYVDGA